MERAEEGPKGTKEVVFIIEATLPVYLVKPSCRLPLATLCVPHCKQLVWLMCQRAGCSRKVTSWRHWAVRRCDLCWDLCERQRSSPVMDDLLLI